MGKDVKEQFGAALEGLIERVKQDRSVLAAILCGSLSHDRVWEKSDIDLVLVTVDDKKAGKEGLSLYADGINVHAMLVPRAEFRKTAEGAIRNSFWHSLLAKGRILYTHDETIAQLCQRLKEIGERDTQLQLLSAASWALPAIYKAHKWFLTRRDLDYTALWILNAANSLARVEVLEGRRIVDREALPLALELNPTFFKVVYTDLLNSKKSVKAVEAALRAVDEYLEQRTERIFAPVIEYLREVRETRSATEIEDYFMRNFGLRGMTGVCEYLADRGILGKASAPVKLTKISNVQVEELGFFYAGGVEDEW
jgi:uncharacterized protein